ncbi:DUF4762 domain-containing protein [unidentified bacterial endosymbiont]|uniref:DUF4762 domain-containing protein n=1 Tax=unidentified bacterial endosymbiont TaxID=2355 RepID=UPI00209F9683|nr:DUF4762 domain-containing protein [unidentified bacterial endosymbiont]
MKRMNENEANAIVGGDDCSYKNYRWEWSNGYKNCMADYYCSDKHGTSYQETNNVGPAACLARGM